MKISIPNSAVLALSGVFIAVSAHAAEVATYTFNNTLAAQQPGVISLTAVDPQGVASYGSDTVFGNTRSVYNFGGNTTPDEQGGLVLDTNGLISNTTGYSAEILFKFNSGDNAWRRILDSLDRTSDSGLYIDTHNNADIFPVDAVQTGFVTGTYYDIALTMDPATAPHTAIVYVNGVRALTASTDVMDLRTHFLNFFLDNTEQGGQGEYSPGSVALIRIFDAPLSQAEITTLAHDPFAGTDTPEPSSWFLLAPAAAALLFARRRVTRTA